jgi:hypothetical protein
MAFRYINVCKTKQPTPLDGVMLLLWKDTNMEICEPQTN